MEGRRGGEWGNERRKERERERRDENEKRERGEGEGKSEGEVGERREKVIKKGGGGEGQE